MGNYENLKQSITEVIRTNGNQEITGAVLQSTLLTIISTVGANATFAGIATPTTNPGTPDGSVFYLASESGTYPNFGSIELQDGLFVLMWNGSWSSQQIFGVDDEPTANSDNLVKSGGVQEELALGTVYDVSAKNPTAGPNNDGKWESLSTLLSDANLNTLIPTAVRKGGMSIKFVQSSDNNYIQARLMSNAFTTDITKWQIVDKEPTAESKNLVESGGVFDKIHELNIQPENAESFKESIEILSNQGEKLAQIDENGANFKNLKSNGHTVAIAYEVVDEINRKADSIINVNETTENAEEQVWCSNDGNDVYVKIGTYGIKAKDFQKLDGDKPIFNKDLSLKYLAGVFHKWGFIGDSLMCGTIQGTDENDEPVAVHIKERSWPYRLMQHLDVTGYQFCTPGQSTRGWCTGEHGSSNETWAKAQTELEEAYIIALGENDYGHNFSWTKYGLMKNSNDEDIETFDESLFPYNVDLSDFTNNKDSFVGWYSGIIQRVRSVNPKCFFFVCTLPTINNTTIEYNKAIRYIASIFDNVFVIDLANAGLNLSAYMQFSHMSSVGYEYASYYTINMISNIIAANPVLFKGIEFILENQNYKPY